MGPMLGPMMGPMMAPRGGKGAVQARGSRRRARGLQPEVHLSLQDKGELREDDMRPKTTIIAVSTAAVLAAGCGSDFDPFNLVDKLRVM